MYCAVHGPMPGSVSSAASVASTCAVGSSAARPSIDRARERHDRAGARAAMMPSAAISRWLERGDRAPAAGTGDREPRAASRSRSPNAFGESPGDRRRRLHRHLLAEDRAHRDLEAVDRAGQAQARDGRSASGPSAAAISSGWHARSKSALHAREHRGQRARERSDWRRRAGPSLRGDGATSIQPACALPRAQRDRAAIARAIDRLHAGDRAPLEEGEHRGPVVGRAVGEVEGEAVSVGARAGAVRRSSPGVMR